jgi:hypothetical protein
MKKLLLVLGGFIAGGVSAFFVSKAYYRKYYADLAQQDIDDVKETFERRREELEKTYAEAETLKQAMENYMDGEDVEEDDSEDEEESEDDDDDDDDDSPKPNAPVRSRKIRNAYEQAKVDYNLISKKEPPKKEGTKGEKRQGPSRLTDVNDKLDEERFIKDGRDLRSVDRTHPYLISQAEFVGEFDHHDKFDLYYYMKDGVLCDDQEEPVSDIEGAVGLDVIRILEKDKNAWVRNEPELADYHIIRVDKSYNEAVRGIVTSSPRARRIAMMEQEEAEREKEKKDEE